MKVTIGGERLGSGKKMKVDLNTYNRSTHDLSYTWRSTMASGTLVPFMSQLALPGDTFDIDLNADVLTHPTIGPLFGSYKVQLDVFQVPFRLYIAELHMNKLGIGRDMSQIVLPQLSIYAPPPTNTKPIDNQQINPSCIFSYLGIRGLGTNTQSSANTVHRMFNAIPYLAYWDIYKNYYANKQEEVGACIHKDTTPTAVVVDMARLEPVIPGGVISIPFVVPKPDPLVPVEGRVFDSTSIIVTGSGITSTTDPANMFITVVDDIYETERTVRGTELFNYWQFMPGSGLIGTNPTSYAYHVTAWGYIEFLTQSVPENTDTQPQVVTFPLSAIDAMRTSLLRYAPASPGEPFIVDYTTGQPYSFPLLGNGAGQYSQLYPQEGLALKTYQSDLFNNWISTEWIDGTDGIAEITAIDTSSGSFTIDELNLSQKVYDMLNRIAISGGTYDDWLDAVYTHERQRSAENPMYLGGLIKQIVFQEVVAQSQTDRPLGDLAGRGVMGGKHKGGKIVAKIDEPSYIIGIVSITPYVDYSQGNAWDMNLRTMNDLHKPALDQIGFQDLITDQLTWWDTYVDPPAQAGAIPNVVYKSLGKQPAWVNYMTNVNKCLGNFANEQQMWMTLNRRYALNWTGAKASAKDLTTYIDPVKFNHIFADTRRDAQNFWVQIASSITARRKMSAKIMPNL